MEIEIPKSLWVELGWMNLLLIDFVPDRWIYWIFVVLEVEENEFVFVKFNFVEC